MRTSNKKFVQNKSVEWRLFQNIFQTNNLLNMSSVYSFLIIKTMLNVNKTLLVSGTQSTHFWNWLLCPRFVLQARNILSIFKLPFTHSSLPVRKKGKKKWIENSEYDVCYCQLIKVIFDLMELKNCYQFYLV